MCTAYESGRTGISLFVFGLMMVLCSPGTAHAQSTVRFQGEEVIIYRDGRVSQSLVVMPGKSATDSGWMVLDNVGNAYPTLGYLDGGDDVILVGTAEEESTTTGTDGSGSTGSGGAGEDSGGGSGGGDGYQDGLQYLRDQYGAVIEHDDLLGVDLVRLPGVKDPISLFFRVVLADSLHGRPLIDFFDLIEVASAGMFDDPAREAAIPHGEAPAFPNDPYYRNQWNVSATELDRAHWLPGSPRKSVRVAVIDSGIGVRQRDHEGLDGAAVYHEAVAPTTGFPVPHALGILTLLADRNHDGSGITSLLGGWSGDGCSGRTPFLAAMPPEVYSYNAGDVTPSSIEVARAIRRSIERGVDVINLSLRLAYSPVVEEALREALRRNVLVVAAAGNYDPAEPNKPAAFPANMQGVIAVGAARPDGSISSISAREGVDILAPGEQIVVGGPMNMWYETAGTSYAAPHVTAVLVLMRSLRPDLTPEEALEALKEGAAGEPGGLGLLRATETLNLVLPPSERVNWGDISLPDACSAMATHVDDDTDGAADFSDGVRLLGSYPNPFNPETRIRYVVPEQQHVRIEVLNALGQVVRVLEDRSVAPGEHEVRFEAHALPSGLYVIRMETGATVRHRSVVLVR